MRLPLIATLLLLSLAPAQAAEASVAVAANFTKPAEELAAAFKAQTGDDLVLSFGATGALYTQISQGAPFEVLLAADATRPERAVQEGLGVAGSVFTYAIGTLALYGPGLDLTDGEAVLRAGMFQHLAIAEPKSAPYGAAAMQTLEALGLTSEVAGKIVTGENISQTLQFVDSGNAELGFVALSQVIGQPATGFWRVPPDLYQPIRQDAVLLETGADNRVALAFLDFLRSSEGRAIIAAYGYETESP